ncbi:hypothetical protein [Actinophytocola sp.]|uniref:hypothetical protein n=1 Tax=Actinophytocola sp. TaxID=1872138 RepID=UPI002D7FC4C2|nr:hypothetical protein [Actinophytocola sp.]HET9137942.1 hypothetical protein [Actinophytocola sp.]
MSTQPKAGKAYWAVLLILIPPLAIVAAWFLLPIWAWLAVLALLMLFLAIVGKQVVGLSRGAVVDLRNKVSLSRFQTVLWTVLIVSAFFVAAVHNVRGGQADPLGITIPPELWILLGVSVTSLVGAGLIKQEKARSTPNRESAELALTKAHLTEESDTLVKVGDYSVAAADEAEAKSTGGRIMAKGVLAVNDSPQQSSWLDLFRSEEVGGIGRLDLGKIQMFYFTLIIVGSYAVAVGSALAAVSAKITALPGISEGAIALLGISHATYLTTKTVSSTSTSPAGRGS